MWRIRSAAWSVARTSATGSLDGTIVVRNATRVPSSCGHGNRVARKRRGDAQARDVDETKQLDQIDRADHHDRCGRDQRMAREMRQVAREASARPGRRSGSASPARARELAARPRPGRPTVADDRGLSRVPRVRLPACRSARSRTALHLPARLDQPEFPCLAHLTPSSKSPPNQWRRPTGWAHRAFRASNSCHVTSGSDTCRYTSLPQVRHRCRATPRTDLHVRPCVGNPTHCLPRQMFSRSVQTRQMSYLSRA